MDACPFCGGNVAEGHTCPEVALQRLDREIERWRKSNAAAFEEFYAERERNRSDEERDTPKGEKGEA